MARLVDANARREAAQSFAVRAANAVAARSGCRAIERRLRGSSQRGAEPALDRVRLFVPFFSGRHVPTRGEADLDELAAAADATDHVYASNADQVVPRVSSAACAVHAAVPTAATAAGFETPWYDSRQVEEAANHAASFAAAAIQSADPDANREDSEPQDAALCPSLAAIVRAQLTCPTLDQVRNGLEEMLKRNAAEDG